MIRVLLVEGHDLVRQALEMRLRAARGLELVGSTGHYEHAVQQARALHPDVILLETKVPAGLETLRALRAAVPEAAVIILTSYHDNEEEGQALQLGASCYLLKGLDTKTLVRQIRAAAAPVPAYP